MPWGNWRQKKRIKKFEDKYFNGNHDMTDNYNDPEWLIASAYDESILEMKEHLLAALKERKRQVLPLAFGIFSKIQNKQFRLKDI